MATKALLSIDDDPQILAIIRNVALELGYQAEMTSNAGKFMTAYSRIHPRVITVDIQNLHQLAASNPLWKRYVTDFIGSSTDPDIVARIAQLAKGKKVLVALDSDHSMAHVLKELALYSPMVSKGSYLIVEDTHMDGVPTAPAFGPGPMAAVRKFLEDGGDKLFEQDVTREAYIMTFNPGGWLRRK